jgi:hypothetical protein
MQTCSRCSTQSPDSALTCPKCQADLREYSATAVALKRIRANARISAVRLAVPDDACPACMAVEGTYPKDRVPTLPVEGCSEPNGCCCFYEPVLEEIYP